MVWPVRDCRLRSNAVAKFQRVQCLCRIGGIPYARGRVRTAKPSQPVPNLFQEWYVARHALNRTSVDSRQQGVTKPNSKSLYWRTGRVGRGSLLRSDMLHPACRVRVLYSWNSNSKNAEPCDGVKKRSDSWTLCFNKSLPRLLYRGRHKLIQQSKQHFGILLLIKAVLRYSIVLLNNGFGYWQQQHSIGYCFSLLGS